MSGKAPEPIATKLCPYRFNCEAVEDKARYYRDESDRAWDVISILLRKLCEAREIPTSKENMKTCYAEACAEYIRVDLSENENKQGAHNG